MFFKTFSRTGCPSVSLKRLGGVRIMFICSMVLWCAGILKSGLSLDQLQQI